MTFDLKDYNSLGFDSRCEDMIFIDSLQSAAEQVQALGDVPIKALGAGSNVILMPALNQTMLKSTDCNITVVAEDERHICLRVGAGHNWHQLVLHTCAQGWWGLENLALIPGTVGAAPVQNIGAYGVEVMQRIVQVRGLDLERMEPRCYAAKDCGFSYRNSRFKHGADRNFFIAEVDFLLDKQFQPQLKYGALKGLFDDGQAPTAQAVIDAVVRIRQSKLPDPKLLPNVGSFFHNPIVDASRLSALLVDYPDLVHYPEPDGRFKLAAGWMIDQANWRGFRRDGVGVHQQQALVLVNYSATQATPLLALADDIALDIKNRYGVSLVREPELIEAMPPPSARAE